MADTSIDPGIARSLSIYRAGDPAREALMDNFYRAFMAPGDLVFDAGAHVGDRTACFRRLGTRVVTIEPQPAALAALRRLHGADPLVTLEACAVGAKPGVCDLHLNEANPTVSTLSADFINAARGADGWEDQKWSRVISVPVKTLDELIATHGEPRFMKLDVEGWEAEALQGLTRPLRAMSFEFTVIQKPIAYACIARLCELGDYRFRASPGEFLTFETPDFISRSAIEAWIANAPAEMGSGDIYARLS